MEDKKILVTGASGFIGKVVVNRLANQNKVVKAFVRKNSNISGIENDLELCYGDLRNYGEVEKAVSGCKQIIHIAGITKGSLDELNSVNLVGLKNILQAALKHKIEKVIFLSSIAVYGECLDATESSPYNPYNDYGRSKVIAEEYIKKFNQGNSLPIVTLRPSHVYGPGGKSNIQKMFKYINRKKYFIFGSGDNLINLVYVHDLVNVIMNVLENNEIKNEDFIISGPKPHTTTELSNQIAKTCGVMTPISLPYSVGYFLGLIGDVITAVTRKKMPLSRTRVKNLVRSRSFKIDKAKKILNYTPSEDFNKTLTESYHYYKKEGLI